METPNPDARLRELLERSVAPEQLRSHGYGATADVLEAVPSLLDRIEALEAGLRKIAQARMPLGQHGDTRTMTHDEAILIARDLLKGTGDAG